MGVKKKENIWEVSYSLAFRVTYNINRVKKYLLEIGYDETKSDDVEIITVSNIETEREAYTLYHLISRMLNDEVR